MRCVVIDPLEQTLKPINVTHRSGYLSDVFGLMLGGPTRVHRMCGNDCPCGVRLVHCEEVQADAGFLRVRNIEQIISGKAVLVRVDMSERSPKLVEYENPLDFCRDELIEFLPSCKLLGWRKWTEVQSFGTSLMLRSVREPIFSEEFEPVAEVPNAKL